MTADPFTAPLRVPPCAYQGNALDRADPLRRRPEELAAARAHPEARWLLLDKLRPLTTTGADGRPALAWLPRLLVPGDAAHEIFLGFDGTAPRFAAACDCTGLPGTPIDARTLSMQTWDADTAVVAQARALIDWHARHGFCAVCGAPSTLGKAGYGRQCSGCGAEHFPRTDPVVIMLAIKDGHALIGRQASFPPGMMSALAGFIEPGETVEEAVRRELWEEAGIRAGRVRYVSSQPWPFPSSLMIGAFAESEGFELNPDYEEMEALRWIDKAEARAALAGRGDFNVPPAMAIAHSLMAAWAALPDD